MAGKTYIKSGNWTKVNKIFVKLAGTWTNIQKAYVKVYGVWEKVFDSSSNAPVNNTTPKIRYKGYSDGTTNDPLSGYPNATSPVIMGPDSSVWGSGVAGDTNNGPEGGNKTYLWGWDGKWSNDTNAYTYRYMMVNTTNDSNTFSYYGDATGTANTGPDTFLTYGDKVANTYNRLGYLDENYLWFTVTKKTTGGQTLALASNTPLKIIKQNHSILTWNMPDRAVANVGSVKQINFKFDYSWYNSPDLNQTYIEWFKIDDVFNPVFDSTTRVRGPIYLNTKTYTTALNGINTNGSTLNDIQNNTWLEGTDTYTIQQSDVGKRILVRLVTSSSYTRHYYPGTLNDIRTYTTVNVGASPPSGSGNVTVTRDKDNYNFKITDVGTWTGSPTSYRYQWFRREASPYGYYYVQLTDSGASGTFTHTAYTNNTHPSFNASAYKPSGSTTKDIIVALWATNSNGESESPSGLPNALYSDVATTYVTTGSLSSFAQTVKYSAPTINSFSVTGGSAKATYSYSISADDPNVTIGISWSGAANGSTTVSGLTKTNQDIALATQGTYNFTLTVSNSATNAESSTKTSNVNNVEVSAVSTYTFSMGNTLHISTNGYVSFDTGQYSLNILTTGTNRVLGIWPRDLMQGGVYNDTNPNTALLYHSTADTWTYEFRGFEYNSGGGVATDQVIYQVKFYNNQQYADVKYTFVGSTADRAYNPGMYYNSSLIGSSYTGSISTGTQLRFYFNGSTPTTISTFDEVPFGALVYSSGLTAGSQSPPTADDSYTSNVTSANQFDPPYFGTTWSNYSTNGTSQLFLQFYAYKDFQKMDYNIRTGSHNGTSVASGEVTPTLHDSVSQIWRWAPSGLSANTQYYITVTPKNRYGQSGSAYQISTTYTKTSAAGISQTTKPRAGSSSLNYFTGEGDVLYPNSIYWTGGTYDNASSVTSVLIYSTNTSNLSGANGQSNSLTRTSNPYPLAANDGTGSPYYFGVRDTVVGNNGTTQYFYSHPDSYVRSQPGAALTPTLSAVTSTADGFYFDVTNYDSNYTWSTSLNTTPGSVSSVGTSSPYRVTVTGLAASTSRTVTVSTSRTGYNNGSETKTGTSNAATTYTVTYDGNGNTGGSVPTDSSSPYTSGSTVTVKTNSGSLTRTDYQFLGWNTKADGTGTSYAASGSATFTISANTTLYARWGALYTISFDSKGGTSVSSIQQSTSGGSIAKPTDPTKTGNTFGGWSTTDGGTTAVSWPRTPSSSETLYAIWTATSSAPSAPTGVSVGSSTLTRTMYTYLTRNSATNKTQTWSAEVRSDFRISWTNGTGATSHEVWYTTSSTSTPTSTTSAQYTGIETAYRDDYWFYGSSATTYYYYVRARNSSGASSWVYAGSKNIPALSVTSFTIRIYRGNGSSFSNPASAPAYSAGTYTWTGLTNRDASPDFGHYGWAQGTINGTVTSGTSSTV